MKQPVLDKQAFFSFFFSFFFSAFTSAKFIHLRVKIDKASQYMNTKQANLAVKIEKFEF